MPTELFLAPLNKNKVPDLQLLEGESLGYTSGTKSVEINDIIIQKDTSMPTGYHTILSSTPIFDNSDPPVVVNYKVHALRTSIEPVRYGGYTMIAPARGGLPLALVLLHTDQQTFLDTLHTRLRAIKIDTTSNFYGRIPLTATTTVQNAIANKLDELSGVSAISGRPGIIIALTDAATAIRAISNLSTWKQDYYDVMATLFQLPSRKSIENNSIGEVAA